MSSIKIKYLKDTDQIDPKFYIYFYEGKELLIAQITAVIAHRGAPVLLGLSAPRKGKPQNFIVEKTRCGQELIFSKETA